MMMARLMAVVVVVEVMALLLMPLLTRAVDIHHARQIAARHNITCVLVFGDSSVDPGNNNHLSTPMKCNFPPYGKDFFNGQPTGRFSNGRLATDFIAEVIGYTKVIPAFLDPNIKPAELIHGVSFASAASGYDDFTANISNVLPVSKQLEYFRHYKNHLARLVGVKKADDIIKNAIFLMSMGTNDFLQNYYIDQTRPKQYTLAEYQDYLVSRMIDDFKEMHSLGARRLIIVGVPPLGCMPLVKTLHNAKNCVESYNQAALSLNTKIKEKLVTIRQTLGVKDAFVDCYNILLNAINNPKKYGLEETGKGCCGTGEIEYGAMCKGVSTCPDASKYIFWDSVHPTQKMYEIVAEEAINSLNEALL